MASSESDSGGGSGLGTWTSDLQIGQRPVTPAIESLTFKRCPVGHLTSIDIARSPNLARKLREMHADAQRGWW
jgi:hypothetical protein